MQKELPLVKEFAKQNKWQSIWRRAVRVMACVVVFCTTYALILPAITMEQPLCELEEHVHSDGCYVKQTTQMITRLECSYETLGIHRHTEECYDADQELICGCADFVVHEHNEACFDGNGVLVCELAEIKAHEHGDECYQVAEQEMHVHDDTCYTVKLGELICGLEETEGHAHTAECMTRGDLVCTLEETEGHAHGENCSETVLVCELTDPSHVHEDACYQTNSLCDIPETAGHAHSDDCYGVNLTCDRTEEEAHFHTDVCYGQIRELTCQTEGVNPEDIPEPELICEITVVEEHVHTDSCFVTEEVPLENVDTLTCGQEEGETHTHTDRCYGTWELVCGKEEHTHSEECMHEPEVSRSCGMEAHRHSEECLDEEGNLNCALVEHTHDVGCYADLTADVEDAVIWEATLPGSRTGIYAEDLLAVAKSQLGYAESAKNYIVDSGEIRGYTRYGAWHGDPYGDWSAMFVAFCLHYAGVDKMPVSAASQNWIALLKSAGLYAPAADCVPEAGDIVFFVGNDGKDHVGIVSGYFPAEDQTAAQIQCIEGDSDNAVCITTYSQTDPTILGYGLLPEQERIPIETPSNDAQIDSALEILICGTPGHVHGDSCYDTEGTPICEKQEHIHAIGCVDPSSPVGHASAGQMMRMLSPRASVEVNDIEPLLDKILIYDSQNNVVYNSDDSSIGTGQVKLGENCRIELIFKENTDLQFASGTDDVLKYTIPPNLVSEIVADGVIRNKEDNIIVAVYTIQNNNLIITPVVPDGEESNFFGKFINANLTIEFDAEVSQSSGSEGTNIDFSDKFQVDITVVEEGYLNAEKEFLGYDPDTREITYKCKVTAHGGKVRIDTLEDYNWGIDGDLISIDKDDFALTDTYGNDIKDRWYISIDENQGIWMQPYYEYRPYYLGHNESITMTYKVKIDDSVDFNFNHGNGFYVHGNNGKDDLYDEEVIYTPIRFTNVEKTGALATEELNGQTVNVLQWTVAIENEALEKITMRDQLSEGQTFCQHKDIILEAFKPDGSADYFQINWSSVKQDNTNTWFEYELPEGYSNYRLHYYSHYEFDENGDAFQTFENTVTTTIDGKDDSFDGTGSVGVLGVPPGISKTVPSSDDKWVTFQVECSVPGALYNMPNVLFYDTLASWGAEPGYVQQHPDSLTVTITPEGGAPYTLQPYSEGGPTENTYLLVEDGQTFVLYFNTSQPSGETSVWKCNVDSTLTVSYRISLDSPMLDNWGGEPNGETLRQFFERTGQAFTNSAALTYSAKDEVSDSINWSPPREPDPNLRKNASPTNEDGVYNYSVWFNSGDGEASIFHKNSNGQTEVQSLVLEDVFDSRMEYVPGSLCVNVWGWWDHSELVTRFRLREGQNPDFTTTDDGKTCMTVSAANLFGFEGVSNQIDHSLLNVIQYLSLYGYQYEFTYQLRVKDEVKNTTTEGILQLDNTAYIKWKDSDGPQTVEPAHNHVNYNTGILQKGMETVENSNTVNFSILVNHNALNLTGVENGSYVLYDTMSSNLTLLYNSLVVEVINKNTGAVDQKLSLADCKFSYDQDKNQMTFNLPDEKVIRLTYSCRVSGISGETAQIGNVVELHGRSTIQDFVDTEFKIKEHQGSADGSSTSLKFHLQKQDGNNHNSLAGVTFRLYGDVKHNSDESLITANGKVLYYYDSYTTGADGIALIAHTYLAAGHLYALVEESPPSGYVALSEPYVFYMENPPEGLTTDIDVVFNESIQVVKNYPIVYVLPETGGTGNQMYTMAGLLLMLISAAYLMYSTYFRRREEL